MVEARRSSATFWSAIASTRRSPSRATFHQVYAEEHTTIEDAIESWNSHTQLARDALNKIEEIDSAMKFGLVADAIDTKRELIAMLKERQ